MKGLSLTLWCRNPSYTVFDVFPQLKTIWSEDLTEAAIEGTQDWETDPNEPGEVFLICLDDNVIGMTGWYVMSERSVGLRWHGIVPKHRRNNYASRALNILLNEFVPPLTREVFEVTRSTIAKYFFLNNGFQMELDPKVRNIAIEASGYTKAYADGYVMCKTLIPRKESK